MERVRRGWRLAGQSWEVLKAERSLAAFPILGGLAALFLCIAFYVPGAILYVNGQSVPAVAIGVVGLYLSTFAAVFFSVALVGCADRVLRGEPTSIRDGLALASDRTPQIAGWAGVLAAVNLIIRALESRGWLGQIVAWVLTVAWALVAFLAVPVLALEGTGPRDTFRRSAGLFKARWGEQVVGTVSITLAVFVAVALPAILAIVLGLAALGAFAPLGIVLIALGCIGVLAAVIVGNCLTQIFAVALYRFATGGEAVGPFSHTDLAGAVTQRKRRLRLGFGRASV